jgi:hypothetical protein
MNIANSDENFNREEDPDAILMDAGLEGLEDPDAEQHEGSRSHPGRRLSEDAA